MGALRDALHQARREGRCDLRGIGAATAAVSDADLEAMHDAGVRGLRFIEMPAPDGGGRYRGGVGVDQLVELAPRMRELGWHAQLWCQADDHAARLPELVRHGVPLVVDHMGSFRAEQGVAAPAFQRLLGLLSDGLIWVKLSLCRNSRLFPDYPDLRDFHDALVGANPQHLLWGSDWPHVRMGALAPDVGHLLDLFLAWTGDRALHKAILVDNPATLFGFEQQTESTRMPDVEMSVSRGIATVTLNRPPVHALTTALYERLAEIFEELGQSFDAHCAILTATGRRAFSRRQGPPRISRHDGRGGSRRRPPWRDARSRRFSTARSP